MRKVLLIASAAALLAGMAGTASATSFTATALVQEENANCGHFVEGLPINGTAKFTRTGNILKVTETVKHLAKLATYYFYFYNANPCVFLGQPGVFVTTATGAGKVTASMEIPENDVEFFVDVVTSAGAPFGNDSFIVTLPKP
jgi:hypothetical protein